MPGLEIVTDFHITSRGWPNGSGSGLDEFAMNFKEAKVRITKGGHTWELSGVQPSAMKCCQQILWIGPCTSQLKGGFYISITRQKTIVQSPNIQFLVLNYRLCVRSMP